MTNDRLAMLSSVVRAVETEAREAWKAGTTDADRGDALKLVRLITPVYAHLDRWISARVMRAQTED